MVAHPSLSSLASLFSPSQSSPSFAWREESGRRSRIARWSAMPAMAAGWGLTGIAFLELVRCGVIKRQ